MCSCVLWHPVLLCVVVPCALVCCSTLCSCVLWHPVLLCVVAHCALVCYGTMCSCVLWHPVLLCVVVPCALVCCSTLCSCVLWHPLLLCVVALCALVCCGTLFSCVLWHTVLLCVVAHCTLIHRQRRFGRTFLFQLQFWRSRSLSTYRSQASVGENLVVAHCVKLAAVHEMNSVSLSFVSLISISISRTYPLLHIPRQIFPSGFLTSIF